MREMDEYKSLQRVDSEFSRADFVSPRCSTETQVLGEPAVVRVATNASILTK
jgi:hypothetical protein